MSSLSTPWSKSAQKLATSRTPYVSFFVTSCGFIFLISSLRFLYILYISVDVNFKLKGKDRGLKDVKLMPGWGPFVEESRYQAFITNYVDQPKVSTFLFLIPNIWDECSPIDQYVRVWAWCDCQGTDMVHARLCCLGYRYCHLLLACTCTKEWRWRPAERQEVRCIHEV